MMNCPICNTPLRIWHAMRDEGEGVGRCICANAQCELYRRNVMGCGQSTDAAANNFLLLAKQFDHNIALK
jgi:hypothetical protein